MASRFDRTTALHATVLAGFFVALAAAAPSGCFLSTTGLGPGGGGATSTTTTTGGSGGGTSSSSSSSSSSSGNVECTSPAMCGTDTQCVTWACTNNVCVSTKVMKGDPCLEETGVCDGAGMCVVCTKEGTTVFGCPTGEDCVGGLCTGCTNGMLSGNETDIDCGGTCTPCANGKACKVGADCVGGACDAGICVSCTDGIKNGTETDVDCGGGVCPGCALGTPCTAATDCASGACSDGVCCSSDCSGACASCAMASHVGTCTDVPKGINGQPACPNSGELCDGTGTCAAAGGLSPIGTICTMSSTCFNQNCVHHSCTLQVGEPCNDPIECDTGRCASNVCATCAMDADCLSGKCDTVTSRCKLPSGYFCDVSSDCLINNCFSNYCVKSSGPCTVNADCTSRVCKNGTCSPCTSDADCESNKCAGTTCLAPTGAYCNGGADCGSGSCVPAPVFKKCQ